MNVDSWQPLQRMGRRAQREADRLLATYLGADVTVPPSVQLQLEYNGWLVRVQLSNHSPNAIQIGSIILAANATLTTGARRAIDLTFVQPAAQRQPHDVRMLKFGLVVLPTADRALYQEAWAADLAQLDGLRRVRYACHLLLVGIPRIAIALRWPLARGARWGL